MHCEEICSYKTHNNNNTHIKIQIIHKNTHNNKNNTDIKNWQLQLQ